MLDIDDCRSIIEDIWAVAEQKTQLPAEWTDFFDLKGPTRVEFNNLRSYHRFYLRGKVIVEFGDTRLAGYTKDVSRVGMGILSPIQLLPRQVIRVWLPEGRDYLMKITRCTRIGEKCYECGMHFHRVTDHHSEDSPLPESKGFAPNNT